ncbi:MAG TPA: hypothetical protein VLL08_16945 [Kineosporiaceae bacterium]|nr:hypothetical protein [Kineosporiaceae bacterium]
MSQREYRRTMTWLGLVLVVGIGLWVWQDVQDGPGAVRVVGRGLTFGSLMPGGVLFWLQRHPNTDD